MKLFVIGAGLVVAMAGMWVRAVATGTLQPDELKAAFTRLADVPMGLTQTGKSVELTATIPDDEVWRRIRKLWGEPSYIVLAVSPGNYMYCLSQLGLTASVTADGVPVTTVTADQPPYDYSANLSCTQLAVRFAAAPGARLHIAINGRPDYVGKGDRIVLEPYWTDDTKDRRVGFAMVEELHLNALWRILVNLGVASTIYGFWGVKRRTAV
jgi:hypothetical protein